MVNYLPTDILIRRALASDLDALLPFARELFYTSFIAQNDEAAMQAYMATAFARTRWEAEFENLNSAFYLALSGDAIAGYLKVNAGTAQTELADRYALEVERIYVSPVYQGRAVAPLLMNQALAIARQMGAEFTWLGVWEHNPRAIRFYEKNGFSVFDRHVFTLGTEQQTDLMMKRLPEWEPAAPPNRFSLQEVLLRSGL